MLTHQDGSEDEALRSQRQLSNPPERARCLRQQPCRVLISIFVTFPRAQELLATQRARANALADELATLRQQQCTTAIAPAANNAALEVQTPPSMFLQHFIVAISGEGRSFVHELYPECHGGDHVMCMWGR